MSDEGQTNEIYLTLAGQVDTEMVKRVFNSFGIATQQRVTKIHLLVHSPGGFVGDGIGIYNYIRNFPIPVVAYNAGNVASIAAVLFLAAHRRIASTTASFMIHKVHANPPSGTRSASLKLIAESVDADDVRTETILRDHLTLSDEQWAIHAYADLHIDSTNALACGLIHETGDFKHPQGSQVFSI